MTARTRLRGRPVYFDTVGEPWRYSDNDASTVATHKDRNCGHCGKYATPEGHDGCLGTLPDVMNACCGHGNDNLAYVQFLDRSVVDGAAAVRVIRDRAAMAQ